MEPVERDVLQQLQELHNADWIDAAVDDKSGVPRTAVARWRAGVHALTAPGMLERALNVLKRRKPPVRGRGGG